MAGRSYEHSSDCISGYRLARWGSRYSVSPNTSGSYECDSCAAHRIGKQLQGLHQYDAATVTFTTEPRRNLMRRALRRNQFLGMYRFDRCKDVLAIGTRVVLSRGVELPIESVVSFAQQQGVDLTVVGWSHNRDFPTITEPERGAEVFNFPSFLKRRERNEILRLLGWRAGRNNPQHAGIPIDHLLREAINAYAVGRLTPSWTCPIPITDGTEEWDENDGVVLGSGWGD